MPEKAINHFMSIKITDRFWDQPEEQRTSFFADFQKELANTAACSNFYQISPLRAGFDFLVWSTALANDEKSEDTFFGGLSRAISRRRPYLQLVDSLWGYTRPSVYSRGPSAQEIDPFAEQRQTYLVIYPFVKTVGWYLLGRDTRQGMMNEHIRVGHQYPEIKQLLLYSFGVQDQEFVVVYETENLYRFSELVNELRGSDVREYTQRDTPVYTGILRTPAEMAGLYGAGGEIR